MNLKHIEEAEKVGLKLLDESPLIKENGIADYNYKRYQFLSCGHENFFQPTHVRRNHIKCNFCFETEIVEKLLLANLKLVSKGSSTQQVIVENLSCGHTYEIYKASRNKRTSDTGCKQCYEDKLEKEASEQNLQLIGISSKGGTYRQYKFNLCGHKQDIVAQCIPVGRFRCQQCKEDKYKAEASLVGLEYIGLANNTKYECQRRIYKLPCGCSKELRMDHAASGSYLCDNCEGSYYQKPSMVYLLKMHTKDFSWLKFGFAKDMQNRLSNYGFEGDVEILLTKQFETGLEAMRFEKAVHKKYKEILYPKAFMKKYLKHNGFTECYPLEFEQILIKEING